MEVGVDPVCRVRQLESLRDLQRAHAPLDAARSAQEVTASSELKAIQESMEAAATMWTCASGLKTAVAASMRAIQSQPRAEAPDPGAEAEYADNGPPTAGQWAKAVLAQQTEQQRIAQQ